ncbi:MAG: hypothetical protein J6D28_06490 [Bacilli bacterium]|nr:hypothetical protein [Bacilli bacterium]
MEFIKRHPKIIILAGKAGSGKSKVASIIGDYYSSRGIKCISVAYASYLKEYAKNILGWDGNESSKPREFLQEFGVSLIKNNIDSFFLINRVKQDILVYSYFYDVIVVTDARFIDEIEEVKMISNNVVVINIVRGESSLTLKQKNHITETALDDYHEYDYIIENEDLEDLKCEVKKILEVI